MTERDRQRWLHILEAADQLLRYAEVGYDEFQHDAMRQDACVYQLLIIGEAATRLESSADVAPPLSELRYAAAMRNFLIHEYWKTDIEVLWQAITQDVPRFAKEVRRHLDS